MFGQYMAFWGLDSSSYSGSTSEFYFSFKYFNGENGISKALWSSNCSYLEIFFEDEEVLKLATLGKERIPVSFNNTGFWVSYYSCCESSFLLVCIIGTEFYALSQRSSYSCLEKYYFQVLIL